MKCKICNAQSILFTESKLGIGTVALALLFKYGISFRNLVYSVLGFWLLVTLQHRLIEDTQSQRDPQWEAAIMSILDNPIKGHGLAIYDGYDQRMFSDVSGGAHNAYLSILMQYGLLFGSCIILIIVSWR